MGSFDPDFGPKPLTYQWDINYDGTFVEDATGQIVSMSWGALQQFGVEAGKTHPVALRVYDGAAEAFAFTTLSVAGAAGGLVAQSEVTQLAAIDQVIGADGDAYDDVGDEYSWL